MKCDRLAWHGYMAVACLVYRLKLILLATASFDHHYVLSSIISMQKHAPHISNDAPNSKEPREPEAQRSFLLKFVRSLAIACARKDHSKELEHREIEKD